MRKKAIYFLTALLCVFLGAGMLYSVNAAEYAKSTLSAGKTYLLSNIDKENYYYITNKGASQTQYDAVYKDSYGNIESYGSFNGSLMISSGGSALITITGNNGIEIEYPSDYIKISETSGKALMYYTLNKNETVDIKNADIENLYSIKTEINKSKLPPKYDYVCKDISGGIMSYGGSESGNIQLYAGGSTLVTASEELRLYIPFEWADYISFESSVVSALFRFTVNAGETFTVANKNPDSSYRIDKINPDSYAPVKYDFVNLDSYKNVIDYGINDENQLSAIIVSEGGTTRVTAKAGYGLSLLIPGEWAQNLSFEKTSEPALYHYTLSPKKTLRISNADKDNDYIIYTNNTETNASPRLDYVYKDKSGVRAYGKESITGAVSVESEGTSVITIANNYPLRMWMPYEWKNFLSLEEKEEPALHVITLNPSMSVGLKNLMTDESLTVSTDSANSLNAPKYDYLLKDDSGRITDYGNQNIFENLIINDGKTVLLTASKNYALKLWFPNEWINTKIRIVKTENSVLYEYRLSAGKSVIISNASADVYEIMAGGSSAVETSKFDYVVKDEFDRTVYYKASTNNGEISIDAMGSVLLTAGKGSDIKILIPNELIISNKITITETKNPALYYKTLKAGQGIKLTNNSKELAYNVMTNAGGLIKYDYVYRDLSEKITGYGIETVNESINIEPGSGVQITAGKNSDLAVYMPYEWTNGMLTLENAGKTVQNYMLKAGNTILLTNVDAKYVCSISTNSTSAAETPKYDYVIKDSENYIINYGSSDIYGNIIIPASGKVIITAVKGNDLNLWYPAEWSEKTLKITEQADPALYYYTVKSEKAALIINSSSSSFNIKNNSGAGITEPKYDYTYSSQTITETSGDIAARINTNVRVTASNGYDLKLWIPFELSKRIRID